MQFMDAKLQSTAFEIEQFMESTVWRDFSIVAKARIEAIKCDIMQAQTVEELRRFQGEAFGVEFWIRFPEQILQLLKEDEKIRGEMQNAD
jgi:hypothetical protein